MFLLSGILLGFSLQKKKANNQLKTGLMSMFKTFKSFYWNN